MLDGGDSFRFVAPPTTSDVRMSFSGGTTTVMKHGRAGAGRPRGAPAASGDRGIDRAAQAIGSAWDGF